MYRLFVSITIILFVPQILCDECVQNKNTPNILICSNVSQDEFNNLKQNQKITELQLINLQNFTFELSAFSNWTQLNDLKIINSSVKIVPKFAANLTNPKSFTLANVEIGNITGDIFHELDKLRKLTISDTGETKKEDKKNVLNSTKRELFVGNEKIFASLTNLEELKIQSNITGAIPSRIFSNLLNLKLLNLDNNNISIVPENIFELSNSSTNNLTELSIRNNKISKLFDASFNYCDNLQILDLSMNNIQEIPVKIFKNLTKIEKIDFSSNKIVNIFHTFEFLSNLVTLNLSNNPINYNENKYSVLKKCKHLWLSHTNLFKWNETFFKTLIPNVEELFLNSNNLTLNNANESFKSFNSLLYLNLNQNQIHIIKAYHFSSLKKLRKLTLENNKISKIENDAFKDLEALKHLSLNSNNLTIFEYFSDNEEISLPYLEEIDLSNNQITLIKTSTFAEIRNLKKINLSYNEISEIEPKAFDALNDLTELNLLGNNIQALPLDMFDYLINLKSLNLANNKLSFIQPHFFKGLDNLEELSLQENNLKFILKGTFDVPKLRKLDLSVNSIYTLPPNIFSVNNLTHLYIQGNRLSYLNREFFKKFSLNYFEFGNNPFQCKCLEDIVAYLKRGSIGKVEINSNSKNDSACIEYKKAFCVYEDHVYKDLEEKFDSLFSNSSISYYRYFERGIDKSV